MTIAQTDQNAAVADVAVREPALVIRDVHKYFQRRDGVRVPAVAGIDLRVEQGEFVVLLGPSGCGKTTLLRCIAGLEEPDSGTIQINGQTHYSSSQHINTTPDRRKLGMIFQSYALWPHMKVFANVAYPLKLRKLPRAEIRQRVMEVLRTVGIEELAEQFPGQLSGGQQQRVAVARALVSNNGVVLFDEPLSNVDAKVREQLRYEILRMQEEIGFAAIYVTHDQDEAMELADRIAVLNSGHVAQLDRPEVIYGAPADRYVAKFVGAANEVSGTIIESTDTGAVARTVAGDIRGVIAQDGLGVGDEASIIVRPEWFSLNGTASGSANTWPVELVTTMFMGDHRGAIVTAPGWGEVRVHFPSTTNPDLDTPLTLHVEPAQVRFYRNS